MPVENIQYSEKYCDDSYEYRYVLIDKTEESS